MLDLIDVFGVVRRDINQIPVGDDELLVEMTDVSIRLLTVKPEPRLQREDGGANRNLLGLHPSERFDGLGCIFGLQGRTLCRSLQKPLCRPLRRPLS
jgi:hypothetical protein